MWNFELKNNQKKRKNGGFGVKKVGGGSRDFRGWFFGRSVGVGEYPRPILEFLKKNGFLGF